MLISFHQPLFLLAWLLIPALWLMLRRSPLTNTSRAYTIVVGALRSLLILLLGLALADPRLMAHSDQVNLFFCLDMSESIGGDKKAAADAFMEQTLANMGKEDQAGLVVFGKHPSLEQSLSRDFEPLALQSYINPNFSNLYEALQFTIGKFPQQGQNRIVFFSDGNENLQDAVEMAYLAGSLGVEIYPVPLSSWFVEGEVFMQALETPPTAQLETPYDVRVIVVSSQETEAELIVLRNDQLLSTETLQLQPGKNVFTFTDSLAESGLHLYKAVLNCPADVFFQNNEGLSFTRGTRRSQVLYVGGGTHDATPFLKTLDAQGVNVVSKAISELGGSIYDLLDYNAIILDNVPALSLAFTLMENIERYVKDMGGGLLMIGGDQSFGAGYYKKTPIESALPVYMDAPTNLKISALCLIFVIDKSSSMTTRYTGKSKLEMAKVATFSSIELLNPTDAVGIVAFDSEFRWSVPITQANERQEIAEQLSQLKEGGGTNLFPALKDAFRVMREVEASRKHIIVLSDGLTDEANFESLVQQMRAEEISISTVSIGSGADVELMRNIASWGNGRSYYTEDPDSIPKIFTGETKIITKELISEKTVQPAAVAMHDIMRGVTYTDLPVIHGHVVTYPKAGANVLISTAQGPLLAAWQYGLGRSAAFTSDLSGRWGKEWVQWQDYGRFVAQMVKWAQRRETPRQYAATIEREGEVGRFTVDVTDEQNQYLNNLSLQVNVLFPSEEKVTLSLEQIAPGRYRSDFPAEEIGEYYFSLFGESAEDANHPEVFGFGIPYTDEFNTTGVNIDLLEQLAALTDGATFALDQPPSDLFEVDVALRSSGKALWPYLALAFLGLLLLDVAVRKLVRMR